MKEKLHGICLREGPHDFLFLPIQPKMAEITYEDQTYFRVDFASVTKDDKKYRTYLWAGWTSLIENES